MKKLVVGLAVLSLLCAAPSWAGDAKSDLKDLVEHVKAKLQAGQKTPAELSDELKSFDTLLATHKGEDANDLAEILFMKGVLYLEVFGDVAKGSEIIQKVKKDYPESEKGKDADKILAQIAAQVEAEKAKAELVSGKPFPDFSESDLEGKPLSIASYKGKIVLIDFWATWCGPCMRELPNVISTYEKYHDRGFEIIGITLDEDKEKVEEVMKDKNMTWRQYFDGKGWQNKLSQKYGVDSIPTTFLLDKEGKIIGRDLRGTELTEAVEKALGS